MSVPGLCSGQRILLCSTIGMCSLVNGSFFSHDWIFVLTNGYFFLTNGHFLFFCFFSSGRTFVFVGAGAVIASPILRPRGLRRHQQGNGQCPWAFASRVPKTVVYGLTYLCSPNKSNIVVAQGSIIVTQ